MGARERPIKCRNCKEEISLDNSACPHCGTSPRNAISLIAATALGLVIGAVSLLDVGELWFFGAFGLAVAVISGAFLYDRQQRIQ